MIVHKGETVFRQGESGPLFRLNSGLLKIVRVHADGRPLLVNIITPGETIPHHSLLTPAPYYGTAIALITSEIEVLPAAEWYAGLASSPDQYRVIALQLQDKLRMMQQRIDQLTELLPEQKLNKTLRWFETYIGTAELSDVLTQDEIGQFIGIRRETVNRLLRAQRAAAGPKNS
ncbi:Crp/Fnr family transcriptional regulator [Paenibacillus sp. NEAU-GSW1]|uniref:Crp/Fnr family transcriptional regulator n=1 Tax=Paenibacillus sp. NEAU-GSW1 TaxID=2682486 RepID=UPI0012E254E8|nr:Crp/Fnr family transcriptional regulator [Paenibacillus sp. NEAU-GSW1]MUT68730.1 cyclic nucleotide-binding domain-containing protein [Paenibacillus sp. NEAU-GSW1]